MPEDRTLRESALSAVGAATAAGITVSELHDIAELGAAAALLTRLWGSETPPVTPELLRALAHAGSYVVGAYADGDLVAASVAFFAAPRERTLHSHITGVDPHRQRGGVGHALKLHQRAWCLERDVHVVTWTFDPLIRRNARFNLTKLGAVATEYLPDFYGPMRDAYNRGDVTDRCLMRWELTSGRAVAAAAGSAENPDVAALVAAGARVVVEAGDDGRPHHHDGSADVLLCATPSDAVALRAEQLELAREWREALRRALGAALDSGYRATAMTRTGYYVLTRVSG